jgi:hypothetical protein
MPALKEFLVSISRSATETADLKVMATSQDAAEDKVFNALDTTRRVDLSDLDKIGGIKVGSTDFNADDESSWEVS